MTTVSVAERIIWKRLRRLEEVAIEKQRKREGKSAHPDVRGERE